MPVHILWCWMDMRSHDREARPRGAENGINSARVGTPGEQLSHTPDLLLLRTFSQQISVFLRWAMLGSNQRPLPCEGSVIVCCRFLERAKYLQIERFGL